MRESLAKAAAIGLTGLVVLLAALFAGQRNPVQAPVARAPSSAPPALPDPSAAERGRAVYEAQSCSRCHSIEGRGNPRSPLDGVGSRSSEPELLAWVTGASESRTALPRSTLRAKEGFRDLREEELDALVAFLSSLR